MLQRSHRTGVVSRLLLEIREIFLEYPVVGRGVCRGFRAGFFLEQRIGQCRGLKPQDLLKQTLILLPVVGLLLERRIVEAAQDVLLGGAPGGIIPSKATRAILRRGPRTIGASRQIMPDLFRQRARDKVVAFEIQMDMFIKKLPTWQ